MPAPAVGPVRVVLANLDHRLAEMLEIYARTESRSIFTLAPAEQASVALVDLDGLDVRDVVRSLRRAHPHLLIVGLGGDESAGALADRRVTKPLTLRALQSALASVGRDGSGVESLEHSKFAAVPASSSRRRSPDWSAPPPGRPRRAPKWDRAPGESL
jgi:hypothetical protein